MRWLWVAWGISWLIASAWSNRTEARPQPSAEMLYRVVQVAGALLLFFPDRARFPIPKLWLTPPALGWALAGLTLAGFLLCWWARLHLGRMWSSSVTRKADHHIVDTGPYAWVRHPIYTGIITAAAAVAAQEATIAGFGGVALFILGFWIKARLEERFLRTQLGAEQYDSYAKRTWMLFPGL